MSNPYIGEIRIFAGTYAPVNWAFCDGSLISIGENPTLFNLIGTTYGGDGTSTFALPDLRSRVPLHQGAGFTLGQNAGVEQVTLTTAEIPTHNHSFMASLNAGAQASPLSQVPAANTSVKIYSSAAPTGSLASQVLLPAGGSQPHSNLQPYLSINFIIALFGIYPSQ